MANFAQLDENNVVIQVIVVDNNELLVNGRENEDRGILFCKSLYGENTKWKQTSYNQNFRYNYAGIGFTYDKNCDAFIPPKPFPSWKLNVTSFTWDPPATMPLDGKPYWWDENSQSWKIVEQ